MLALFLIIDTIILFGAFFAGEHLQDILDDLGSGYEWAFIPCMIVIFASGIAAAGYTLMALCQL